MRHYLFAAACLAASAAPAIAVPASKDRLEFGDWSVDSDAQKCVLTYEDNNQMIDIVAEGGGEAQFATDPGTTGDIMFKSVELEVVLAGKSQGFRKGQTRILSASIGPGYVMKFEPQMLTASGEQGTGEIRRGGKVIFRFPMKGAAAAAKALIACQANLRR